MQEFTVYIRKYSEDLCKKLEAIGFKPGFVDNTYTNAISTNRNGCYFLWHFNRKPWMINRKFDFNSYENEELFLAIAALSQEHDKFQYFIVDEDFELNNKLISKGTVYMCMEESNSIGHSHKMCVSELKPHFLNGRSVATLTGE